MVTQEQAEVLAHSVRNSRFVTDDPDVLMMAESGLLHDHGAISWTGGMHCLTITRKGRESLAEWRESQPKPKPSTRSQRRYSEWLEVSDFRPDLTFGKWLKNGCKP